MENPKVIYKNKDFIIFYKPPYFIMDTTSKYDKITNNQIEKLYKTDRRPFLMYVRDYLKDKYNCIPKNRSFNVCQRLDINTSGGVLVSIGDNKKWMEYRDIITNKSNTIKVYICLVNGNIKKKKGFIYKNIKCVKQPTYCETMNYNEKNETSMSSISYYQVVKEFIYNKKKYSLVFVRIFTGRTHQIRVHMKSLGHPIVSDDRYSIDNNNQENIIKRMFLHNIFLSFSDNNNKNYKFKIPLPKDINECLNKLELHKEFNFSFKEFLSNTPNKELNSNKQKSNKKLNKTLKNILIN